MENLWYWLIANGGSVLMWVLVALGGLVSMLVLKMLKDGKIKDIVGRALAEVGDAVRAVAQTYVDAIKAASADGVLTDQEKAEAKAKALALAKSNIGAEGLKKLAKILGVDIDGWLGTKIEAAVGAIKAMKPAGMMLSNTEHTAVGEVSKSTTSTVQASVPR